MLGLPALVIAVLGVSALCWAQFGLASSLEKRYKIAAEDSGTSKDKIRQSLGTEMRMLRAANRGSGANGSDPFAGIPEDDARRKRLSELQEEEQVYLEKLIALNPNEFDYRFQLAIVSIEQGDMQRGMALIQNLAPETEPGYAKAHLWLSQYFLALGARSNDRAAKSRAGMLALTHAEHCLRRDQGNKTAKLIKARLLNEQGRLDAAYAVYEELFATDVAYYEPMIVINQRLNRDGRNEDVLEKALEEFLARLNLKMKVEEWVRDLDAHIKVPSEAGRLRPGRKVAQRRNCCPI